MVVVLLLAARKVLLALGLRFLAAAADSCRHLVEVERAFAPVEGKAFLESWVAFHRVLEVQVACQVHQLGHRVGRAERAYRGLQELDINQH